MSRPEYGTLGDLSSNGSGVALRLGYLEDIAVCVSGTHDGDVTVEVRMDTTQPFVAVGSFTSGNTGVFQVTYPIYELRVTLSSNTTGTANVRYAGRDFDRAG